ncbi:isoleucine--tRNA ligase [Formicincola oecophyllae]|uniref:Isoleucine--tRNA ligase n=1 Tax=Formicincola oecophyllae TaxID=2558361 RepID=A0A4Y6UAG4_9PROT|nr:isoleucine--tRNA ligase [Formicincola oecophyllae]QDH13427.1 isoleucine--tRNA ligase [Formicincola oecophyllae]
MTSSKSTASSPDKDRYRETVFLPRTSFPMRGNLPKREPEILASWEAMALDEKIAQQGRSRKSRFTLHDGPPYANGHIHIGHALNKVLKDVINRAQRMSGHEVRYQPGWDCHGLPIEWKVEEEYRKKGKDKDAVPVLQFRDECRQYAWHWLEVQKEGFKRLGVQAEWQNRYATADFSSEAAIVEEIGKFLMNGRLYRGLRPVMWSPVEKTALAEAEIEYHDVTSTTIHVAFPNVKDSTNGKLEGVSAVIWTTTPWTMPANRAIAAGPDIDYVVVEATATTEGAQVKPGMRLLVAAARLDDFLKATGISAHKELSRLKGAELEGSVFAHPWRGRGYDHDVPVLLGDWVTTDAGTGLVHMAPAHGQDDFTLCTAHGIKVDELVEDGGTYASWVPELAGVHIFKATAPVRAMLEEAREDAWNQPAKARRAAGLLAASDITHSYPHSWRSRKPVIFRATPQWFISLDAPAEGPDGDGTQLRERALEGLAKVDFVPAAGRTRLTTMVAQRPDWCVSRQRVWGVPIAVFVEKRTGEVLRDSAVMERIVKAFREKGADAWYQADPAVFLGPGRDPADYEQVFDVVDVWFESGCTHRFVLHQPGMNFPADLYAEGSDQHRGWFQSSLLESVGAGEGVPYKAIITHGFVLDGEGRKMSKSLGNVIAPSEVADSLGADVLRLWVMNSDVNDDLRISKDILRQQGELYRRLRNTLRWTLGALDGFTAGERVVYDALPPLEKYILHRLAELHQVVAEAIKTHRWSGVYPLVHAFCNNDLSAFYFDVRKDAIYCDASNNHKRRSARTVLDILHRALCTWLAPVLVFTAEEAWQARFGHEESVHMQRLFQPEAAWLQPEIGKRWDKLRAARRRVTTALEGARREGLVRSSLEASVTVPLTEEERQAGQDIDWADFCIASAVLPLAGGEAPAEPVVSVAEGSKCERCWRNLPDVGQHSAHPGLCLRCVDVMTSQESTPA